MYCSSQSLKPSFELLGGNKMLSNEGPADRIVTAAQNSAAGRKLMKRYWTNRWAGILVCFLATLAPVAWAASAEGAGVILARDAEVDGVKLHYLRPATARP